MNIVLQVGVKVLLKNKDGKFLLLKRSASKYKNIKGMWDIPGGRINPGTNLLENLRREVEEEVALKLVDKTTLIAAQDIILPLENRHVVRLTYLAKIKGTPKVDMEENIEFKWLKLDEMKKLYDLDHYLKQIIDDIVI